MTNDFKNYTEPLHGYVKVDGGYQPAKILGVENNVGWDWNKRFKVELPSGSITEVKSITPYPVRELGNYKVFPIVEGFLLLDVEHVPDGRSFFTQEKPLLLEYDLTKKVWDFLCETHAIEGINLKGVLFSKRELGSIISIVDIADPVNTKKRVDHLMDILDQGKEE